MTNTTIDIFVSGLSVCVLLAINDKLHIKRNIFPLTPKVHSNFFRKIS